MACSGMLRWDRSGTVGTAAPWVGGGGQVREAGAVVEGAGEEGTAAAAEAQQQLSRPGDSPVMDAVHAAMQDDLGTPQVRPAPPPPPPVPMPSAPLIAGPAGGNTSF